MHLVLRLQGGWAPDDWDGESSAKELVVAAGGYIKQSIVRDGYTIDLWDLEGTISFGLQLFDATLFKRYLGISAPPTPINAETYDKNGYSFFALYEQEGGISGHFPIESVGDLDKGTGKNESTHEAEAGLSFPTVGISSRDAPNPYSSSAKVTKMDNTSIFLLIRELEKKV